MVKLYKAIPNAALNITVLHIQAILLIRASRKRYRLCVCMWSCMYSVQRTRFFS